MQFNKNNIPVNVALRKRDQVEKKQKLPLKIGTKEQFKQKQYKHFAELTKFHADGENEHIIGPYGIPAFHEALSNGFTLISDWHVP